MKKLTLMVLLGTGLVACTPKEPSSLNSVTYGNVTITLNSAQERAWMLNITDDLVNGSQSVKDNYDLWLQLTGQASNSAVLRYMERIMEQETK